MLELSPVPLQSYDPERGLLTMSPDTRRHRSRPAVTDVSVVTILLNNQARTVDMDKLDPSTPVYRALIGRHEKEAVTVKAPGGHYRTKIVRVR